MDASDAIVFIGLGAAVGVVVFLASGLIRSLREDEESEDERPRLFRWRATSTPPRLAVGEPAPEIDRSTVSGDVPVSASRAVERIAAYAPVALSPDASTAAVAKRDVSMKQSEPSRVEGPRRRKEEKSMRQAETRVEPTKQGGIGDYGQLGERITAVLTSAESAAAEIRESATHDAETIRREAEKRVAYARAEAEKLRAGADSYREETHKAADSYSEETHRAADAAAAKARAEAEEKARAVVAEAKQNAKHIEAEAVQRRDALRQSAAYLEQRIAAMVTAFRGMASDLEGLVPNAKRQDDKPQEPAEVLVDDTLEDALKPERAA